ncbi:MAG: DUF6311 domain-containing protein [Vicinamibacterales bacterium]
MNGPLAAAAFGAAFFVWVHGLDVLHPGHIDWLMRSDWRFQFLGWQYFRQEPWAWPPGLIAGYNRAPLGSAIGLTDSVPLMAFALKPLSGALPMPFQYIGAWLLLCFALHGALGALIVRLWSRSPVVQAMGGATFVLMPTLLNRTLHPALCAQWLVLWAILIYCSHRSGAPVRRLPLVACGAVAGLVHPYLAVMVLAIEVAFVARLALQDGWDAAARAADAAALALVAMACGWWASGLLSLPATALAREGLTVFSMNVLGPVSPSGWSAWLPEQPIGAAGQGFEGFQYLGAGVLALAALGTAFAVRRIPQRAWVAALPLAAVSVALALYALSPRVTLGGRVLVDYQAPWLEAWFGMLRVTGRFFWPAAYSLLALSLGAVLSTLRPTVGSLVVGAALVLQAADLHPGFAMRRADAHAPAARRWFYPFRSTAWDRILAPYAHLALILPPQCGATPVPFEAAAYLASLHGLSVNAGEQSRWDADQAGAYCDGFRAAIAARQFDRATLYLLYPPYRPHVLPGSTLFCGTLDGMQVCAEEATVSPWRALVAPLPDE